MHYIPNILTMLRFAMVPLVVVLLQDHQYFYALVVFLIAGISDGLDGFIAKRFNATTRLGAVMDPLADKALLVSTYVMLGMLSLIPFWLMVIVVFRDIIIIGGFLMAVTVIGPVEMEPRPISKVNTFVQIVFVLLLLIALAWDLQWQTVIDWIAYVVLFTSIVSGVNYVWIWSNKAMQEDNMQS